jgi:threonine dehydrogenase-like Zn-dependent dehydrogenase
MATGSIGLLFVVWCARAGRCTIVVLSWDAARDRVVSIFDQAG